MKWNDLNKILIKSYVVLTTYICDFVDERQMSLDQIALARSTMSIILPRDADDV